MIYTCTFTPSIDYTTYLPKFEVGALNRSEEVYFYPGGKGINVSRVLKRLDMDSTAIAFAGGFTGEYIEQYLQNEMIKTDFIHIEGTTRINVKIKSTQETELNGPGPSITKDEQETLLEKIFTMNQGDFFVLAGSIPKNLPNSFLESIVTSCRERNIHFVLDTSGQALKHLLTFQPMLIKPNIEELEQLFNTDIKTAHQAFGYAKKLVAQGVQHVIVSMGGEGALLVTEKVALLAKVPQKRVINTVGSGDSLVSGFIASYSQFGDPEKAFHYGVASGSATAFRLDLCEKADVEALLNEVSIIQLFEEDVN